MLVTYLGVLCKPEPFLDTLGLEKTTSLSANKTLHFERGSDEDCDNTQAMHLHVFETCIKYLLQYLLSSVDFWFAFLVWCFLTLFFN